MAPRSRRKFPFHGTATAYAKHLEEKVSILNEQVSAWREYARDLEKSLHINPVELNTAGQASLIASSPVALVETSTPVSKDAADFISKTPTNQEQWSKTCIETQLSSPEQVFNAFQLLTLGASSIHCPIPLTGSTRAYFATLKAYQELQHILHQNAIHANQLYNYSLMLFFNICTVARKNGISVSEIDELTKICLPNNQQSSIYGMQLRQAASWIARLIEELETEEGFLASRVFLLLGLTIGKYRLWTQPVRDHVATETRQKIKQLRKNSAEEVPLSFSPTFLITYIGPWSLNQVNDALQTNLSRSDYEKRVQVIHNTKFSLCRSHQNILAADGTLDPTLLEHGSPFDNFVHGHNTEASTGRSTRAQGLHTPSPTPHASLQCDTSSQAASATEYVAGNQRPSESEPGRLRETEYSDSDEPAEEPRVGNMAYILGELNDAGFGF